MPSNQQSDSPIVLLKEYELSPSGIPGGTSLPPVNPNYKIREWEIDEASLALGTSIVLTLTLLLVGFFIVPPFPPMKAVFANLFFSSTAEFQLLLDKFYLWIPGLLAVFCRVGFYWCISEGSLS